MNRTSFAPETRRFVAPLQVYGPQTTAPHAIPLRSLRNDRRFECVIAEKAKERFAHLPRNGSLTVHWLRGIRPAARAVLSDSNGPGPLFVREWTCQKH